MLPAILKNYYQTLNTTERLDKSDFHRIADFILPSEIDEEVTQVLDRLLLEFQKARPVSH